MGYDHLQWIPSSGGDKPKDSIHAGVDGDDKLYVARAHHEGCLVPGKLHKGHSSVYIPYNMKEVAKDEYEVLVGPPAALSWVDASGGNIPAHAVEGGHDNGETMFIGRVIHNGKVTIGKVHPSHGVCYVAYGGDELNFSEYEVLVRNALGRCLNC